MAPVTGTHVGLDIGATKILGVVVTSDGRVLAEARTPSPPGGDLIVATAADLVDELRRQVAAGGSAAPDTVGVGIPGLVDAARGVVRHAVNLGVQADPFPFAERLAALTGLPVDIDNDVNAAALGVAAVTGADDLAYLSIGTGLAAASVLDGALRRGARNAAGEIGHIPIDPAGATCQCGQVGCLETSASGSAIALAWPSSDQPPAQALFDAADAGDAAARRIRDHFAARVADAVRLMALAVDPAVIVLGGGVAQVGERLSIAVREALADQAASSPFLASLDLPGRLCLAPHDTPVAAVGAALLRERA